MPHFALHVLLASRVAEVIEVESPAPGDQIQRNAFLHGAVGPDMGFFPGGDHVLSLAAHGKRSGDLVRALHETAETPQHRAFVRGWLTHMLADILIHPIINRAAAELLERKRLTLTPAAEFHSHITVELGLDAVYVNRHRALRRIRLQPFFDDPTTRWITAAVQTAYGVYLEPSAVLRSHQQVVRLQRPLLLLEHLPGFIHRSLLIRGGMSCRNEGRDSGGAEFLGAARPSKAMVQAVNAVVEHFPTAFPAFHRLILRGDLNYNLNTGGLETSRNTASSNAMPPTWASGAGNSEDLVPQPH